MENHSLHRDNNNVPTFGANRGCLPAKQITDFKDSGLVLCLVARTATLAALGNANEERLD